MNYQMVRIQSQILKTPSSIPEKHETFSTSRPVHIFINRTISRLAFKIKDGFKLELQAPETLKLFGSTKNKRENTEWQKCTEP